jgi:hypothetical protein
MLRRTAQLTDATGGVVMMLGIHMTPTIAKEHGKDLQRDAEKARRAKLARTARDGIQDRRRTRSRHPLRKVSYAVNGWAHALRAKRVSSRPPAVVPKPPSNPEDVDEVFDLPEVVRGADVEPSDLRVRGRRGK